MGAGVTVLQVLELRAEPTPLAFKLGALSEHGNSLDFTCIRTFKSPGKQRTLNFKAIERVSIGLELRLQLREGLHVCRLLFRHFTKMAHLECAQPGFLLFKILFRFLKLGLKTLCCLLPLLFPALHVPGNKTGSKLVSSLRHLVALATYIFNGECA